MALKLQNEVKVGILAIAAIVLFIWGYTYLRGKELFSSTTTIYAEYDNISGLGAQALVLLNGYKIGVVRKLELTEDYSGRIRATIDLKTKLKTSIPDNARAVIISPDLMGSKAVSIEFDKPCVSGVNCIKAGQTITGGSAGMFDMVKEQVDPIIETANGYIDTLKMIMRDVGQDKTKGVGKAMNNVEVTLDNLASTTSKLDRLLSTNANAIESSLKNLESLTANLERNNQRITNILANSEELTGNLKEIELDGTIDNANETLAKLQATMSGADQTIQKLNAILDKIDGGSGTIAALMNDEEMANDISRLIKDLDYLSQDLRMNPKRYIQIFGKKQKPYNEPVEDPTRTNQ